MIKIHKLFINFFLYLIYTFLFMEFFFAFGLYLLKDYPVFNRNTAFFYSKLDLIKPLHNRYNILILGGSAASDDLPSKIGEQLQKKIKQAYPNVVIHNIATPAHNSLDNLYKYKYISTRFDLVIYYESINDTRQNCIPHSQFQMDYSHSNWYQELMLQQRHHEFRWIVTPFVIDLFIQRLKVITGKKTMLNDDLDIRSDFLMYGDSVKTEFSFEKNIKGILEIAQNNRSNVLLLGYSIFVPQELYNRKFLGFHKEGKFFKAAGPRTTISAWGYPEHIVNAVNKHNKILYKLAKQTPNVFFYDMDSTMSKHRETYFDICHFTDEGGNHFSNQLLKVIIPIIESSKTKSQCKRIRRKV